MFVEALEKLVRDTSAELAIFCDYEGEAIAFSSPTFDSFDVRLTGAQLGATVVNLLQLAKAQAQAERAFLCCVCEQRTFIVEALPGHYYVLMSLRSPAQVPFARYRLKQVAEHFLPEL